MDYFALDWDEDNKRAVTRANTSIIVDDFGGLSNVAATGKTIFGFKTLKYFQNIIDRLEKYGYRERVDLFGAPYDWRLGPAYLGDYYDKLKRLIEEAYIKNNNTKVHLFSHSLGGWITYILLKEKSTSEWRKKYIDGVTMVAPSWSGSGAALQTVWREAFPYIPFYKPEPIRDFISSSGMFHIHIPNSFYYQNDTIIIAPNGTKYTGRDFLTVLKEHMNQFTRKISKKNLIYTTRPHEELDVPTNIAYNSGISVVTGIDVSVFKPYGIGINMEGDGLIGTKGLDWVCKSWNKSDLRCYNFNTSSFRYSHHMLTHTSEAIDVYMTMIFGEDINSPYKEADEL